MVATVMIMETIVDGITEIIPIPTTDTIIAAIMIVGNISKL